MERATAERFTIFVVSDATGTTAEAVARSTLVQYAGARPRMRRFPFVRTSAQIDEIVEQAPDEKCIIVFTLVTPELSRALLRKGRRKGAVVIDVMGPLIKTLGGILHDPPSMEPGTYRHESEEVHAATEAIHFTLRHDDGQGIDTLHEADLVILGVSRTGKTPTSIYLSCRKLKVANVPVIHGIDPPRVLFDLPVPKVGFRMSLERLLEVRAQRVDRLPIAALPGYSGRAGVFQDLEHCEEVYRRIPGLKTIDVTNRSIEETSEWIARNVLG